MKKRLIAVVMAAAMAMSAFSCVYADDTTVLPFGVVQCDSKKSGENSVVTIGTAQAVNGSNNEFKCNVAIPSDSTYVTVTYTNGTFTLPSNYSNSDNDNVTFSYGVTNSNDKLASVTEHNSENKYTVVCFKLSNENDINNILSGIVYNAPTTNNKNDGKDGVNAQIKIMATSVSPTKVSTYSGDGSTESEDIDNVVLYYGHFYQLVNNKTDITWPEAVYNAHNSTLTLDDSSSVGGYLTNITTAGENDMLASLIYDSETKSYNRAWIGATSTCKREWDLSATEYNDGTKTWTDLTNGVCTYQKMNYEYVDKMWNSGYSVTKKADGTTTDNSENVSSMKTLVEDFSEDTTYSNGKVTSKFAETVWKPYFKPVFNYGAVVDPDSNQFANTVSHTAGYGTDFYWVDGPESGNTCPSGYDFWRSKTSEIGNQPDSGQVVFIGQQGQYWDDVKVYESDETNGWNCPERYIIEYGWDTEKDAIEQAESSATVDVVTFNSVTDSGIYTDGDETYGVLSFNFGVNVDELTNAISGYGVKFSVGNTTREYSLGGNPEAVDSYNGFWMNFIVDQIDTENYDTEITATPWVELSDNTKITRIYGDSVTNEVSNKTTVVQKSWDSVSTSPND